MFSSAPDTSQLGVGLPGPLGLDRSCLAQRPTNISVKTKTGLSDETFILMTDDERHLVEVKDHASWSMSRRKNVYRADGTLLFDIRKDAKGYYFEDVHGSRFVEAASVRSSWYKYDVSFRNMAGAGEPIKLELQLASSSKHAELRWDNVLVAAFNRETSLLGSKNFPAVVASGVDMVLIACLSVLISDLKKREKDLKLVLNVAGVPAG